MAGETTGKVTWKETQTKLGSGFSKHIEKKSVKQTKAVGRTEE
jgi:hypothetical protein